MEQNAQLNPIVREKMRLVNQFSSELSKLESKISQITAAIIDLQEDQNKGIPDIEIVCGPDQEGYAMCEVSVVRLTNFLKGEKEAHLQRKIHVNKQLAELLC